MGKKCTCCLCFWSSCSAVTGVLLVGAGVALFLAFPSILQQQVEETVPLRAGSPTFQQLQSPTAPLFKDIYFFNLTNPQEFQSGAKPQLQEIGPYSYTETREKTILNISSDEETLTYNQTRIFVFNQETTGQGLRETDTICTINLPLVAAVAQLEEARQGNNVLINFLGDNVLRGIFRGADAELYTCQQATPLAWNYTDDLIQSLNSNLALRATGMNFPRTYVNIQVNNSVNDSFPSTIYTGVNDTDMIGQFLVWKGNEGSVNVWPKGMGANDVNGTEGLVFHPFLSEDDVLEVFSDDAFRSIRLVHTDTLELDGIRVFRYGVENETFESAFTNPENVRWGSFNPDGLIFLGPTQDPVVPVFGSKPHFLDGDPVLREKVAGLSPNRSRHEIALHVDPLTGANVQFNIRLQINAQVNQSDDYSQLENVNGTVYFPILYIDERSVLTPEFRDFLLDSGLSQAYLFMTLVPVAFGILLALGIISLLVSLILLIVLIKRLCCSRKLEISTSQALLNQYASPTNPANPRPAPTHVFNLHTHFTGPSPNSADRYSQPRPASGARTSANVNGDVVEAAVGRDVHYVNGAQSN